MYILDIAIKIDVKECILDKAKCLMYSIYIISYWEYNKLIYKREFCFLKLGKLTLDGYFNYGNVLQSYALQHVLQRYGEVDSLLHEPNKFLPQVWWRWRWKEPVKFMLDWHGFRKNMQSGIHGMEMVRQGKIKDWCDRYIDQRQAEGQLSQLADEYDFFVVGSDQVWNPYFSMLEDCFLTFAPPEKRIAYAASISCPVIPKEKQDMYRSELAKFAHISMREQQGADMVKEFSGREVPVVVDPTLLLTPDDWRKVSRQPAWYHGEDYILTYFLGKRPEIVARLEQETGLKVVNLLDENVYEHYVTGPDEFIWAIEHAKLVYTDSFHGTVFSILFRTPFVICNRMGDDVSEKMSSRIDTLLGYFGLAARRGTKANGYAIANPLEAPDWSNVDRVLERERKRADDYLQKTLNLQGGGRV